MFKYLLALMKAIISLCSQFGYCDFLVGVSSDAFEHALVIFLPLVFFCRTPFINDLDLCMKFQTLNCKLTISMDAYLDVD
jgi:hypothetical protein